MTQFISKTFPGVINAESKPFSRHAETLRAAVSASNKKGFTLIELLVVVLIIGILASVAVPQYEVAVGKTRYTEMRMWGERIKRAVELDFLANGRAAGPLDSVACHPFEELDIEWPGSAKSEGKNTVHITSKITASRYSYSNCGILLNSYIPEQMQYIQVYNPTVKNGEWGKPECRAYGPVGRKVCKSLGAKPVAGNDIVFVFD